MGPIIVKVLPEIDEKLTFSDLIIDKTEELQGVIEKLDGFDDLSIHIFCTICIEEIFKDGPQYVKNNYTPESLLEKVKEIKRIHKNGLINFLDEIVSTFRNKSHKLKMNEKNKKTNSKLFLNK